MSQLTICGQPRSKMTMMNDTAVKASVLTKTFVIQHERITTVRGLFINMFRKKTSEQFKALDNVSFAVAKGECFGIIGRNGSGKSTLLKILAGIYRADSGNVELHGRIAPFLELGIGFNHELSGRDNVLLNGAVLGLSQQAIAAKFDEIVAFSELERFIDQKLKNYSSGMQVRLAFSVAIHVDREILLMDEVLAVGDAGFKQKCIREFQRYRDQGRTVILVTHDINSVIEHCDRAMLMRNGRIEKIGDPKEVCGVYQDQNLADEQLRAARKARNRTLKPQN